MPRKKRSPKNPSKKRVQSVQIIAGEYRHRKIDFIAVNDLRPTGARLRETLFNWLQPHIYGKDCLDLFAGSGILGVEALSRGAKSVTFVEKDYQAAQQLNVNIKQLDCHKATVLNTDFRVVLASASQTFDLIFLDPPYALHLLPELLESIKPLTPEFVFIEDNQPFEKWITEKNDYRIYRSKKAGNIYYGLLQRLGA